MPGRNHGPILEGLEGGDEGPDAAEPEGTPEPCGDVQARSGTKIQGEGFASISGQAMLQGAGPGCIQAKLP